MLFNSYEFIFLYLPVTVVLFYVVAHMWGNRFAIIFLTFGSLFFYGWWDFRYVPLLVASIIFNYVIGGCIERQNNVRCKKMILGAGIVCDLGILGYFKYAAFIITTINDMLGIGLFVPQITLPLGISFFTFTQMAYLIDVYRGIAHNHSVSSYSLFVTVFPHLIAGPIINYREMMPQFLKKEQFVVDWNKFALGITLFSIGLFKKVVIADNLALWVNAVFPRAGYVTFFEAWIGALSYTFQLYFDFSGYSEMAIALGLMLGFTLPKNFNSPYQANSMIDFWHRWHMTLGAWVRDYLYIPMGGSKCGEIAKLRNLFVSMLLIGLWHGAGWNFVLWGGIHGALLMINHAWRKFSGKHNINLPIFICRIMTFVCVMSLWVLFRAGTFSEGLSILYSMINLNNIALPAGGRVESYFGFLENLGIRFIDWPSGKWDIGFIKPAVTLPVLFAVLMTLKNPIVLLEDFQPNWKWIVAVSVLFVYTMFSLSDYSEFLYFQF